MPTKFIRKTMGPLKFYTAPLMDDCMLKKLRVTITAMDFETGKVDAKCRKLLDLADPRDIQSFAFRVKPWMERDGRERWKNFIQSSHITNNPTPYNCLRTASDLSSALEFWVTNSPRERLNNSLLEQTSWTAYRFVQPSTHA